jgi:hypothetical protein
LPNSIKVNRVQSFSLEADDSKKTIPFTADMLPMLTRLALIDPFSIEAIWHPSPSIQGIDLTPLDGSFFLCRELCDFFGVAGPLRAYTIPWLSSMKLVETYIT